MSKKYLNDAYGHDENEENAEDEKKLYSKSQIVSTIRVVLEDNVFLSLIQNKTAFIGNSITREGER